VRAVALNSGILPSEIICPRACLVHMLRPEYMGGIPDSGGFAIGAALQTLEHVLRRDRPGAFSLHRQRRCCEAERRRGRSHCERQTGWVDGRPAARVQRRGRVAPVAEAIAARYTYRCKQRIVTWVGCFDQWM